MLQNLSELTKTWIDQSSAQPHCCKQVLSDVPVSDCCLFGLEEAACLGRWLPVLGRWLPCRVTTSQVPVHMACRPVVNHLAIKSYVFCILYVCVHNVSLWYAYNVTIVFHNVFVCASSPSPVVIATVLGIPLVEGCVLLALGCNFSCRQLVSMYTTCCW